MERRIPVNPLSRNGKIAPYVDLFPPVIRDIRFSTPASPPWRNSLNRAVFPESGFPLDPHRLSGLVDVRARIEDRVSFLGWFRERPILQTPHHPARVHLTVIRLEDGSRVVDRDVFAAEVTLGAESACPVPFSHHYAPGTTQNLRAQEAIRLSRPGSGQLWFRLFALPTGAYWDTTLLSSGRYRIKIQAWDVAGNPTADRIDVLIQN